MTCRMSCGPNGITVVTRSHSGRSAVRRTNCCPYRTRLHKAHQADAGAAGLGHLQGCAQRVLPEADLYGTTTWWAARLPLTRINLRPTPHPLRPDKSKPRRCGNSACPPTDKMGTHPSRANGPQFTRFGDHQTQAIFQPPCDCSTLSVPSSPELGTAARMLCPAWPNSIP